jgi:hypothetical protein
MNRDWEGHVVGVFEGYQGGRVYPLSDGSRWRQVDNRGEYVYRERPRARLMWDHSLGHWYLDVEGTSYTVRVERVRGPRDWT